jgi:ParB-like nuclease domain
MAIELVQEADGNPLYDSVHPVAELFPMLDEDELKLMADDLKNNGQLEPIVIANIDGERVMLDGRNRDRACEIADIMTRWREYGSDDGDYEINGAERKLKDPAAWILSKNVNRRHQSKGALAIIIAEMYPDPDEVGGRGKKGLVSKRFPIISKSHVTQARTINKHAPDLAEQVKRGQSPFVEAYDTARKRKAEAENQQEQVARIVAEGAGPRRVGRSVAPRSPGQTARAPARGGAAQDDRERRWRPRRARRRQAPTGSAVWCNWRLKGDFVAKIFRGHFITREGGHPLSSLPPGAGGGTSRRKGNSTI